MTIFITKKQSWIRLLAALVPGIGIVILLASLLSGPQLGPVYDLLLRSRAGQAISPELLLIDTSNQKSANLNPQNQNFQDFFGPNHAFLPQSIDETANILELSAAASLLLTAAEMGASTIIIETPILGHSAGIPANEDEIRYRFNEEFGVLSRNINNLFDAIRLGSVSPLEAGRFVNDLVDLSEQAKERLASALVRSDEESIRNLEKAERVFGDVRRPGDLLVRIIRTNDERNPLYLEDTVETPGDSHQNEYFRAASDRDGRIRRIAPVLKIADTADEAGEEPVCHIVYGALKGRFRDSRIEDMDDGIFLVNQGRINSSSLYPGDQFIPMDNDGALLLNIPRTGDGFRKIYVKDFLDYDEAGRSLRRLLSEAESYGIYKNLDGEKNPVFLWDYSLTLLDELLEEQTEEKKAAWIRSRSVFFDALDSFLHGPMEMNLISDYEAIIASIDIDMGEFTPPLDGYRNGLTHIFDELRMKHREIVELRKKLSVLGGSFCILGPFPSGMRTSMSDAETSALFANSLLTGQAIKPGPKYLLLIGAFVSLLITAFLLRPLGAAPTLIVGLSLSLFYGIVFSASFLITGIWVDPQVSAASSAIFTLFSFLWTLALKFHLSRSFRVCYGASISGASLEKLILIGRPKPYDFITARAAVVAVRNPELLVRGDVESPRSGAVAFIQFRERAAAVFKQAGATILAGDGDTVLACFGSPLERTALMQGNSSSPYEGHIKAKEAPAARAADFVSGLLEKEESSSWQFGMDIGDCCFTWSSLSGYCAFGRPVIRARILASLVSRYEGRPLVTASMTSCLPDLPFKRIAVLKNTDGTNGEAFYEFPR